MNYLKKNFPIFLLSGSLIFAGISFSPSAQGATATIGSLTKSINSLNARIKVLEGKLNRLRLCIDSNDDGYGMRSYPRDINGDIFACFEK